MILWLRGEDGPKAEGGSREMRQETVALTLRLMAGMQTK